MSDAIFARIISELGDYLGIPGLVPTDTGLCQLVFDKSQVVQLVYMGARNQVLLSCPLDIQQADAAQLALIARGNFMQAAGGAVICVAPDGRAHAQLGMAFTDCDSQPLLAAIEGLLAEARRWEQLLREAATATTTRSHPGMFLQG